MAVGGRAQQEFLTDGHRPLDLGTRYRVACTPVASAFIDYKVRGQPTPSLAFLNAGDRGTVYGETVEWLALDPLTPTAVVFLDEGFSTDIAGVVSPLGGSGFVLPQNPRNVLETAPDLDTFPIIIPLDAIAESPISPVQVGGVWALDDIRYAGGGALAGSITLFSDAGKTKTVWTVALAAAQTVIPMNGLEVKNPAIFDINVTAAGTANSRLQVSGRRVA